MGAVSALAVTLLSLTAMGLGGEGRRWALSVSLTGMRGA